MLREPLHITPAPSLHPFPVQRAKCHVRHPAPSHASRSAAASRADSEVCLPVTVTSSTFWRSPYNEAVRHSRSSLPRSLDGQTSSRQWARTSVRESLGAKKDELKGILKNGSDSRESGSESSSEARQMQGQGQGQCESQGQGQCQGQGGRSGGILCKSSVSGSSHQSGEKVQKRVQFEDSAVNCPRSRPFQSARSNSGGTGRSEHPALHSRAQSACPRSPQTCLPHMAGMRPDVRSVPSSPTPCAYTVATPRFVLTSHFGTLVRGSQHALSRSPKSPCCSHPALSGRGVEGAVQGAVKGSSSAGQEGFSLGRHPTSLEFRVYRQLPVVRVSCPKVHLAQSLPDNRARSARGCPHTTPWPFVSSAQKKSFTHATPSVHNDLPCILNPRKPGICACPCKKHTSTHRRFVAALDNKDEEEEDREEEHSDSFLHEDKARQILQWLREVYDKQAVEGRSSVFISNNLREG